MFTRNKEVVPDYPALVGSHLKELATQGELYLANSNGPVYIKDPLGDLKLPLDVLVHKDEVPLASWAAFFVAPSKMTFRKKTLEELREKTKIADQEVSLECESRTKAGNFYFGHVGYLAAIVEVKKRSAESKYTEKREGVLMDLDLPYSSWTMGGKIEFKELTQVVVCPHPLLAALITRGLESRDGFIKWGQHYISDYQREAFTALIKSVKNPSLDQVELTLTEASLEEQLSETRQKLVAA